MNKEEWAEERAQRGKQLVLDALNKLEKRPPYPYDEADEDIVNEVFATIAKDPDLRTEYESIAKDHTGEQMGGEASVNPSISSYVKRLTSGVISSKGNPCYGHKLAKTYSKLVFPDPEKSLKIEHLVAEIANARTQSEKAQTYSRWYPISVVATVGGVCVAAGAGLMAALSQ